MRVKILTVLSFISPLLLLIAYVFTLDDRSERTCRNFNRALWVNILMIAAYIAGAVSDIAGTILFIVTGILALIGIVLSLVDKNITQPVIDELNLFKHFV